MLVVVLGVAALISLSAISLRISNMTRLVFIDYKAPGFQRILLGQPGHITDPKRRFAEDIAVIKSRLEERGISAEVDDIVQPRRHLDGRAHANLRVAAQHLDVADLVVARYHREVYSSPLDFIERIGKGTTMVARFIASLLGDTAAGRDLGAFVEVSDVLDDIPAVVESFADGLDADDMAALARLGEGLVLLVARDEEGPAASAAAADMPEGLATRLRTLRG